MEATGAATRTAHFALFDGLRGLAAIAVFTVHALYQFAVTRPEDHDWYRFAIHLDVAVPIFFAISGFLLYRPFVSARMRGRSLDVRAYAWRRFLRIVPGYWIALPIITLWLGFDEISSAAEYLWYMLFLQLYDPDTALKAVGQAWTLNIEVTYYAFLPLFVLLLSRLASRRGTTTIRTELAGVLGLIAFAFAWQVVTLLLVDVANEESSARTLIRILPIQFDHLGAGMLLAVLSVWVADRRAAGRDFTGQRLVAFVERRPAVVWAAALAVWLAAAFAGRDGTRSSYQFRDKDFFAEHVLYTPFVFLLLLPAVFGDERRDLVRRFLAWRPIAYVGMISYSFYLYHFAVIVQVAWWWEAAGWGRLPDDPLEWTAWLAAGLAGTILLGSLGFHLIEKPFMGLKYRGARSRHGGPPPEAAQARAAP